MSGTMVEVKTHDGVADAYLSRPDDREGRPAVLFLIDIHGLRPHIERMVDRIAERGYVVLAPNLFYRAGRAPLSQMAADLTDPAQRGPYMEQVLSLARALTPERILSDGVAYIDLLERLGRGPVGIAGYCMGARMGWLIAAADPSRVAALGGFHVGGMVNDGEDSPHRRAGTIAAEVYFGHADNDPNMTAEQIAAVERALDEAGVRHRTEVYEGAPHGYTMADTPGYDEAASERHYAELFALLERTIGA
jgi:carboxymethylenebutenolidase